MDSTRTEGVYSKRSRGQPRVTRPLPDFSLAFLTGCPTPSASPGMARPGRPASKAPPGRTPPADQLGARQWRSGSDGVEEPCDIAEGEWLPGTVGARCASAPTCTATGPWTPPSPRCCTTSQTGSRVPAVHGFDSEGAKSVSYVEGRVEEILTDTSLGELVDWDAPVPYAVAGLLRGPGCIFLGSRCHLIGPRHRGVQHGFAGTDWGVFRLWTSPGRPSPSWKKKKKKKREGKLLSSPERVPMWRA